MGKTILMIHGMMGGGWYWENYKGYFEARGYSCLTPDLRYHGMGPWGGPDPRLGTTSLLDYAADLEKIIRGLDEPPVLMGHSMGGLLAQMLGSRGLAKALVLLTPASPSGIYALSYTVLKSCAGYLLSWGFWKKPFRVSYGSVVYSILHLMPPRDRRRVFEGLGYESGRAAFETGLWPFDGKGASRVNERAVGCPVLVIAGSQDRITPAKFVRKVAEKYNNATYKEFSGHAHWVVGEPGWEEIAGYIYGWLDDGFLRQCN